ncbi:MAG: hypothetical protein PGN09_12795 [Sphingomonas fennica]
MIFDFYAFIAEAERRRQALGFDAGEAAIEALRNKGGRRTLGKRALLARAETRARAAGRAPVTGHF